MDRPDFGPEIERMTAYCTYCPKMCRFSCPAAAAEGRETVTPWGMMRLLELVRSGSVPVSDEVADVFHHCTGCRRCRTWCKHENDVPRALWEARRWAADAGHVPEVFEELYERFETTGQPFDEPMEAIDEAPFDDEASLAFWPDCSTQKHHPKLVSAVGRLLEILTGQKLRLIRSQSTKTTPCCGFPLTAAGLEDADTCRSERWPELEGIDKIWTDCGGLAAWCHDDSSWPLEAGGDDPEIEHIFVLLAERIPLVEPSRLLSAGDALLHRSCFVTRQIGAGDALSTIVASIFEDGPASMAYDAEESPCCGGRIHYELLEPDNSRQAARRVTDSLRRREDVERMITTASNCCHALDRVSTQDQVVSLLEMVCHAYGVTP